MKYQETRTKIKLKIKEADQRFQNNFGEKMTRNVKEN